MGEKTKVVLDSNILISAFGWSGPPKTVMQLVTSGKLTNYTSMAMLEELSRVIAYPKLHFPESLQAEIIETVFTVSTLVTATEPLNVVALDPADNRILECALTAVADYIISGDSHLLELGSYAGIPIVKAKDFLDQEGFAETNE